MDNNKIISALSYVSILFAPFLLPLVVYFVIKDAEVKHHAKRAFISHSIPAALSLLLALFGFIGVFSANNGNIDGFVIWMFAFMAIYFIISMTVIVWNFVQAFRVVR
ncbi:hypothetical protein D1B33_13925 [Lysinibacillus yapensis]|uniref:DUF4870 domain-containing protein n=1 Tax=Ureibacillus yapensis TaxID=2304605 RepID=A0A396SK25_9BACL|nr:hypothetical protein [Lysinibacillus yapensis]RHW34741.1 hypothetical protein D1B33_13925 [Lysinibacillus yapensis]